MQFCLFPVDKIATKLHSIPCEGEDFDESLIPIEIMEGARIEDVSSLISKDEFSIHKENLGSHLTKKLEGMKYAIVHRFPDYEVHENDPDPAKRFVGGSELLERSQNLVAEIAACLRLIRPTPQSAQMCWGHVDDDEKFYRIAFSHPFEYVTVPTNQKLFRIRTVDLRNLIFYAPLFRKAMHDGPYWKFRMAVHMHEAGHVQNGEPKARFLLWTAALESLFTTKSSGHNGAHVASERIKDLLGKDTPIYPPGELSAFDPPSTLTVGEVIRDIYCMRNNIAHGDKIPDHYYTDEGRKDFESSTNKADMLMEAVSFIVRQSLLKILKEGIVHYFSDGPSSDRYFIAKKLIRKELKKDNYVCPE